MSQLSLTSHLHSTGLPARLYFWFELYNLESLHCLQELSMDVYQDDRERNLIPHNYPNPTLVYDYLVFSRFGVFFCILS